MTTYLLSVLVRVVVRWLPIRALAVVGTISGLVGYMCGLRARESVLSNLAVMLPNATASERRRLARRTFIQGAYGYIELMSIPRTTRAQIAAAYEMEGWEHYDRPLSEGRGVIMVGGHIGPTSLAAQHIAIHGPQLTAVVEPLHPPRLHNLVAELRGAHGLGLVVSGRSAVREMLGRLRRNEVVGIMCDRDVAGSGEPHAFFGQSTRITEAAATFALRTGAAVVPCVVYRTGLFHGRGRFEPAIEMPRTGDTRADVREGTQRIIALLEEFIREDPAQWAMFNEVWPKNGISYNDANHSNDTVSRGQPDSESRAP
ncbi:MAG: lipid biosynthesis acyltransferase [Chloroflexi bacterium]|nr:lipid biosynthesis acyltransferase [Chloroflexota bacterium]